MASSTFSGGALLSGLRQIMTTSDTPASAQQALLALDTNFDGRVGFDEVAAYAKTKGLDYAATLNEFAKYDADRNGSLDVTELAGALGLPPPAATTPVRALRVPAQAESVAVLKTLRQSFAERAATLTEVADGLDIEVRKEREAEELDRRAADLRSQAVALARRTSQEAREASEQAARRTAEELFQNITELEDKAQRAEVAAAVLFAKGAAEKTELGDVTEIAGSALKSLSAHQ